MTLSMLGVRNKDTRVTSIEVVIFNFIYAILGHVQEIPCAFHQLNKHLGTSTNETQLVAKMFYLENSKNKVN